jgi:hypothetical protein
MNLPNPEALTWLLPAGIRRFGLQGITILVVLFSSWVGPGLVASNGVSASQTPPPIPAGYSTEILHLRFREGSPATLPGELRRSVEIMQPLFTLPKQKLDQLRSQGELRSRGRIPRGGAGRSFRRLPDLSLWYKITLKPGVDAAAFLDRLRSLANVEAAEAAPLYQPPPAVTPDFTGNQGYLGVAPGGIDAEFSWTIPGGNGSGVTIYDVEYGWHQTHEDLSKAHDVPLLLEPGDSNFFPPDPGHGTSVLGEIIADNDAKGVTGVSWGADVGLAPASTTNLDYNPANAILLSIADGQAGDVILLEQQADVCGVDLGPAEVSTPVFDATVMATANGFVVVAVAGNGAVDLDQPACGSWFDRDYRDSGAIIVGAGGSAGGPLDLQRIPESSYGSRVDVQGWGENVMTTGEGDFYANPDDPDNPDFWYTYDFGGTSSASPIVAGAVANLQGIALQSFGTPLTAFQIRALLAQTGSPQLGNTAEHIGPRPDLRAAINRLTEGTLDVFFVIDHSGSMIDDIAAVKAASESVITTLQVSNPDTQFGLSKFEDYPINPFGVASLGDKAYELLINITSDVGSVLDAINALNPVDPASGGDLPESQLTALYQAATGEGQTVEGYPDATILPDQNAVFRGEATKIFLLYTDDAFHLPGDAGDIPYPGKDFVETVNAILDLDPPKVIGISSGGGGLADLQAIASATDAFAPPGGVDCDGDGLSDLAEGEPLVCIISETGEGIGEAIIAIVEAALPILVDMDIRPGDANTINCKANNQAISVALLTTSIFDAATVDHTTVTFEGASETHRDHQTGEPVRHVEDVDGDGDLDLVFHFRFGDTDLTCSSTQAILEGETYDGASIKGTGSVIMVP